MAVFKEVYYKIYWHLFCCLLMVEEIVGFCLRLGRASKVCNIDSFKISDASG